MNVNNRVLLDRCTPQKCRRCDIGYIVRHYVKPIMQLYTNDITDYNMRLILTKCLNTAIMLVAVLIGPTGVTNAGYCDTQNVIDRHKKGIDTNRRVLDKLKPDILNKTEPGRFVFYILMTDAYLPFDNVSKEQSFFCGHVMLLERINDGSGEPFYYFYQSYINQYTFNGHFQRNKNTLKMSWERVKNILDNIDYTLMNGKWNDKVVDFWKDFTFVDTTEMKNSNNDNKIFLCYKKFQATECVKYLEDYARQKLTDLQRIPKERDNEIYGDASLYDERQTPMTNGEIRESLTKLLRQIDINRNQL